MKPPSDFEEFLRLLEDLGVEYLIVGGYAVAFHGYPRFTKDLDVFYLNEPENIRKLQQALIRFGFQESQVTVDVLSTPGNVLTFGVEPLRIDLMNEIDGVVFKEAQSDAQRGTYGHTDVTFIGKGALILNKNATPRLRDKGDVEELQKHQDGLAE